MARLTGYDAIEYAESHGEKLRKYADPIEDARESLTPDEAREIAAEDPALVYVDEMTQIVNIYRCEGDWFYAMFIGGEYDCTHALGAVVESETDAAEHARAMFPGAEVVRVSDVDADGREVS